MKWYVVHAYSGYEKKVADSIVDQAEKLGISEHIEETSVPTQTEKGASEAKKLLSPKQSRS